MPDVHVDLIQKHIEENPHRRGRANVRIVGTGIPVWALVAYWQGAGHDVARVAADYELPVEAVEAALAYYRENQAVIDARLEANEAE